MKEKVHIFTGAVEIMTGITLMHVILMSISFFGRSGGTRLNFPLWLALGLACFLINRLLLRTPRSIPFMASMNVFFFAVSLFLLLHFPHLINGVLCYIIIVVFTIITVSRAYYLAYKPIVLAKHLMHFDTLVMIIFWLFLSQSGSDLMPIGDNLLILLILFVSIISNVVLRSAENDVGSLICGSPILGSLLSLGMIAGIGAIIFALTRLLASGSKTAVAAILSGFLAVVSALWDMIDRFFMWLLSLVTLREVEIDIEPEAAASAFTSDELVKVDIPLDTIYKILAVSGALILALAIFLVIRNRKLKIGLPQTSRVGVPSPRRSRLSGGLKRRFDSFISRLRFAFLSFRYRNTPPGVLIRLEKHGRKTGAPRLNGESFREYLGRLSPDSLLLPLADALDALYYGGAPAASFKSDCRSIRKTYFHRIRQCKKNKTGRLT